VRPATIKAATVPTTAPIPESVVVGLQAAGRAFVEATWAEYLGWSAPELVLLRAAARCLDDSETASTPRARQSAIRLLATLIAQLRLEPAPPAAAPNPLDKYINRPSKWTGVLT
jgi:hypothetical protein